MAFSRVAADIMHHCKIMDEYIASAGLPEPSFGPGGLLASPIGDTAPDSIQSLRSSVLDASRRLHDLAAGPAATLIWPAFTYPYQLMMLQALHQSQIAQAVPLEGTIAFETLAERTGIDIDFLQRLVKFASSHYIFDLSSGEVGHSSISQALSQHQAVQDALSICLDQRYLATAALVSEARKQYGPLQEHNQTAFNMAFGTEDDYLTFIHDPKHRDMLNHMHGHLGFVMSGSNMGGRHHDQEMLASPAIDWETLEDGLVVDLGGGHGHVCAAIAKKHTRLRFVVQDLPQIVAAGRQNLSTTTMGDANVAARISFMEHDFLTPQTVLDADVFISRFVVHDWSDKYVVQILDNLIPALTPSTRIIIMDYLLRDSQRAPRSADRLERFVVRPCNGAAVTFQLAAFESDLSADKFRTLDMSALAVIAGKERDVRDWHDIVRMMAGRLVLRQVHRDERSAFGLVVLGLPD